MQHNGVRLTMGNSLDAYKQRFDHHSALTFWLNGTLTQQNTTVGAEMENTKLGSLLL